MNHLDTAYELGKQKAQEIFEKEAQGIGHHLKALLVPPAVGQSASKLLKATQRGARGAKDWTQQHSDQLLHALALSSPALAGAGIGGLTGALSAEEGKGLETALRGAGLGGLLGFGGGAAGLFGGMGAGTGVGKLVSRLQKNPQMMQSTTGRLRPVAPEKGHDIGAQLGLLGGTLGGGILGGRLGAGD